jgi:hypothetical protein
MCACVAVSIAALAAVLVPAHARAVSPVLEFATPAFPVAFTADGGEVTAALNGFDTVVHCSGSHGGGEITGPRSTVSSYIFTGCETQTGSEGGHKCKTEGANPEEIKSGTIEADLVYIDQAKHEVGMVLNPHGGVYLEFECEGEAVKATGPFLSPVGPINKEATSFTATLSRSGATQTPSEYEGPNGEKLQAIPMGERGVHPAATTGVELGFAIHTSSALQIKAVSTEEIEAKQRKEKAEAKARRLRAQRLSKALRQCHKVKSKHRRTRCVNRAKRRYGAHKS